MEIRRLEPWEHGKTRSLYEEVFSEDDKKFVDYYYKWKIRDSRIYVAEDGGEIQAMVHANPFLVWVRGTVQRLHYIVAVATRKPYRHRGLMRALLELAEQDMAENGECFTFLMPAAEQIYAPLGYRFFSRQRCGVLRGALSSKMRILAADLHSFAEKGDRFVCEPEEPREVCCRPVKQKEYAALADFVNGILQKQYDVFIYRDAAYYERLSAEQKCQGGNVMILIHKKEDGIGNPNQREAQNEMQTPGVEIIGTFCTSAEDGQQLELREVILAPEYMKAGTEALLRYVGTEDGCKVFGCQPELFLEEIQMKPLLMGKAPCGGVFCSDWDADRVYINEVV